MRRFASIPLLGLAVLSFSAACGGTAGSAIGPEPTPSGEGPHLSVHVAAVQTPVPDVGGASRETPLDQRMGILGLELLRDASDPSPVTVFRTSSPVDTGYNDGDDTLVGIASIPSLAGGTYTVARVAVAYTRFTVDGIYHDGAVAVPGQFSDVIALTSNTVLDGASRAQGFWTSSFLFGGIVEGTSTGEGADIGAPGQESGVRLDMGDGVASYVFPVNLTLDPSVGHDLTLTFTVNTYADFHWVDESGFGDEPGQFDVGYGTFETVVQFGANSAVVTLN